MTYRIGQTITLRLPGRAYTFKVLEADTHSDTRPDHYLLQDVDTGERVILNGVHLKWVG